MEAEIAEEPTSSSFDWKKGALVALVFLLLANLGFLNYWVFFKPKGEEGAEPVLIKEVVNQIIPGTASTSDEAKQPSLTLGQADSCPQACLTAIAETCQCQTVSSVGTTKVVYVPLGRGTTTSQTYEEIVGAEAVIDLSRYPEIETVYFEANMKIPAGGGRIYAKIYNVTDKHDAWLSEVYLDGAGPYRAEAKGVILASGRKLYRVKMKSTLGTEGVLDSARLKILLK
jgi:hypothetical protein